MVKILTLVAIFTFFIFKYNFQIQKQIKIVFLSMKINNFHFLFNTQNDFQIQAIVLELMEDVQPEVRMGAAKVLNGLLHCQFIPEPTKLLVSAMFYSFQLNLNLLFIF